MTTQDQIIHELIDQLIKLDNREKLTQLKFNLSGRLPKELLHEETFNQIERIENFLTFKNVAIMKKETTKEIETFKEIWRQERGYISLELTDRQISDMIDRANGNMAVAIDRAADYLLANGLAEVEE